MTNRADTPKLIEDKTIVDFEDFWSGVVRNVRGDKLEVEIFEGMGGQPPPEKTPRLCYTREQLFKELNGKSDKLYSYAVGIRSFPLRRNDKQLDTAEEVMETNRLAVEKYDADQLAVAG